MFMNECIPLRYIGFCFDQNKSELFKVSRVHFQRFTRNSRKLPVAWANPMGAMR